MRPAVVIGRVSFRQALRDIAIGLGGHADEATLRRVCDDRIRIKGEPLAHIEAEVLELLDQLRSRGLRLGVISNCFAEDVATWPQCALASRVDCTVFSCDVGLAKPDPDIYLEALRRLHVDPSDAWYIGDGADDELSGAEQVGLRAYKAVWFLKRWPHFHEQQEQR